MRITVTIDGRDAAKAVRELQSTIEYNGLAAKVEVVAKLPSRPKRTTAPTSLCPNPRAWQGNKWTPSTTGCHWSRGNYTISTLQDASTPDAKYLVVRHPGQEVGRYASFEAAELGAADHAWQSGD